MNKQEAIALYALRYALGRKTYAVHDVIGYINDMKDPSGKFKHVAIRDIKEHLEWTPVTTYADEWEGLIKFLEK